MRDSGNSGKGPLAPVDKSTFQLQRLKGTFYRAVEPREPRFTWG